MKKLLVLLFSILISFNSYGEAWKEVAVSEADGSITYIDVSTIKIDKGYVYYWALNDFKTSIDGIMSMKFYYQGDCSNYRIKFLSDIYYKKPMGTDESSSYNVASGWEDVNTYSLTGSLLSYACDSKVKKKADDKKTEESNIVDAPSAPDMKSIFNSYDVPNIVKDAQQSYNNGDYETAFNKFKKCSLGNNYNNHCSIYLGMMYLYGIGTSQSNAMAKNSVEKYLKKFAFTLPPKQLELGKKVLATAEMQMKDDKEIEGLKFEPFSVIFAYERSDGIRGQQLFEYKRDFTVTAKWQNDDGSSHLDIEPYGKPLFTYGWEYDGKQFSHFGIDVPSLNDYGPDYYSWDTSSNWTYNFNSNVATEKNRKSGKSTEYKITNHNFGNSTKKIDINFNPPEFNNDQTTNLLDTYIDYLIIKNIYEGSNNYYVSGSQMKQVREIAKATEDYYKNSIKSTDNVWQRAVKKYENEWGEYITTLNSFSSYNNQYSGFVDLKMLGIVNRSSKLGISNSNTVKDF